MGTGKQSPVTGPASPSPSALRALEVVELFESARAVGVAPLEAVALLSAVPVVVEVLEALVERRVVDGELGEGDRGRQGYVREGRLVAAEDPRAVFEDTCRGIRVGVCV